MDRTSTSSFGVSERINHDATKFYNSNLYENIEIKEVKNKLENNIKNEFIDRIILGSAENMKELPDNSVHLMITSPPYNVTKEYDQNLNLSDYLVLLKNVFTEVYRVLINGGRACVNVANLGRKPYIPLVSYVTDIMNNIGFNMRGEIIWVKTSGAGGSCAWGSWQSASNPCLRDIHEYILIFSKGELKRPVKGEDTISKEDFLEWTKSIWTFPPESAKRIGHPAPFPIELPYRLIQLYSFKNDIILDPFMGSGTSAIASIRSQRHWTGYDISEEYIQLANERINKEISLFNNL